MAKRSLLSRCPLYIRKKNYFYRRYKKKIKDSIIIATFLLPEVYENYELQV